MNPEAFRAWRLRLGLTQPQAAEALGRSISMLKLYESRRKPVPQVVRLAMYAVERGLLDYDGSGMVTLAPLDHPVRSRRPPSPSSVRPSAPPEAAPEST